MPLTLPSDIEPKIFRHLYMGGQSANAQGIPNNLLEEP